MFSFVDLLHECFEINLFDEEERNDEGNEFQIPQGCQPGSVFQVKTPSGQLVSVSVPPGASAGMTMQVTNEWAFFKDLRVPLTQQQPAFKTATNNNDQQHTKINRTKVVPLQHQEHSLDDTLQDGPTQQENALRTLTEHLFNRFSENVSGTLLLSSEKLSFLLSYVS